MRRIAGLLLVFAVLASAASAEAAVTRLRVDWSTPSQQEWSPRIQLYSYGGTGGFYNGPCARPGNCMSTNSMLRWEEANPNAGGFYQRISLLDDQPDQARQVCFEIAHPYAADWPTNPVFQVTLTVTDPGGATRTQSFSLTKGQTTEVDCTPAFRPKKQLGAVRPPAWFRDANKFLRARGGKCKRSSRRVEGQDPRTGRPGAGYTEKGSGCSRPIPKPLFVKFGGNPNARITPTEGCSAGITNGNPRGDAFSFSCRIFSRGKSGKPTRSSWSCERSSDVDYQHDFREVDKTWIARRSRKSGQHPVKTLARCLARRPPK